MIFNPKKRIDRLFGRLRLITNRCPRCNSDGPYVDNCSVCRQVYLFYQMTTTKNRREHYPPNLATKALWWYSWMHPGFEKMQQDWEKENQGEETMTDSVVKEWISEIPYKMQVVLLSALRGCDCLPKEDVSKIIIRAFRSVMLYPVVENFNNAGMFMSVDEKTLYGALYKFYDHLDHYPNHFVTHLMHAMEIVGYKHPDIKVRDLWLSAYIGCCNGMHIRPERQCDLDERLSGDYGP